MTSKNLYACSECDGTGVVTELNAYDPDYACEIPCSYCAGTGFVHTNLEYPAVFIDTTTEESGKN